MASRGTLVLLVAFALVAGGLMEGVNGERSSFVRRQLAGHPIGASAVTVPATFCPIACGAPFNPVFPNCCQNTGILGFPTTYFCSNNQIDDLNCGLCGKSCITLGVVGNHCCSGTCINTLTDAKNCGICGNKCPPLDVCRLGLCSYAG